MAQTFPPVQPAEKAKGSQIFLPCGKFSVPQDHKKIIYFTFTKNKIEVV
jgi:hypothetical protein